MSVDSFPKGRNVITLNVGGETFTTTYETLTQGYAANSMLSTLASTTIPTTRDTAERIFIDRDGARFRILLNFLRCGTVHVVEGHVPCPGRGFVTLEEVEEEARFYGIQTLVDVVREHIRRLELEHYLEAVYDQHGEHACHCRQQLKCNDGEKREDTFTLDADF